MKKLKLHACFFQETTLQLREYRQDRQKNAIERNRSIALCFQGSPRFNHSLI